MSRAKADGGRPGLPPGIARGLALCAEGRYFDAHEAMEEAWLAEPGERRLLWQGLIQAVVACHHIVRGNRGGARKMIAGARPKLAAFTDACPEIDMPALERDLERAHAAIARGEPLAGLALPVPRAIAGA